MSIYVKYQNRLEECLLCQRTNKIFKNFLNLSLLVAKNNPTGRNQNERKKQERASISYKMRWAKG